jgi:hypothetical protein
MRTDVQKNSNGKKNTSRDKSLIVHDETRTKTLVETTCVVSQILTLAAMHAIATTVLLPAKHCTGAGDPGWRPG